MRSHISSFFFINKSHSWYSLNLSFSVWKTRVLFCPRWTKPSSSLGRFGGIEWTSNSPLWPNYFYLIYPQSLLSFSTCSQCIKIKSVIFLNSSVQSLSHVRLFMTPWITAHQVSLSITNSRSLPKPVPIESGMPSSHLVLYHPLLLLSPIPPSIAPPN